VDVSLTTENTAIVLDSTSDYPDAPSRFPNMRFVPLYVRFGDDTYRDYVELGPSEFFDKLRTSPVLPATSQPTPQDFVDAYEELSGYERIYSLHVSSKVSGTFQSASLAAQELGGDKVRVVDSLTASLAIAMLAHAIQRRLARGTTDDEIDALVERFHRDSGVVFTVETPGASTRWSHRPRGAHLGSLLNVRPILGSGR
jgi:DegV family protein with EDD domain